MGPESYDRLSDDDLASIDEICTDFEERWKQGERTPLESQLANLPEGIHDEALAELIGSEIEMRRRDGQQPNAEEYAEKFPQLTEAISDLFAEETSPTGLADTVFQPGSAEGDDPTGSAFDQFIGKEFGQYRIERRIGQGGMGAVYQALHTSLNRKVALKLLNPEITGNPNAVQRFRREMQAIGQLDHPNIVRAMDAGEREGTRYLAMEFVDGLDLSRLTPDHRPLRTNDACELIRQAAISLQEAHERGMVHRDVKPSNLMLARPRRESDPSVVKLLDLGLALLEPGLYENHELSTTGVVLGTVEYMAPEQGTDSHEVDIRADIYGLGATLYRLLCGHTPFPAKGGISPIKLMVKKANEDPPSLGAFRSDLPEEFVAVVDRMVSRLPEVRQQTPKEVANDLAPYCGDADLTSLLTRASGEERTIAEPSVVPLPKVSEAAENPLNWKWAGIFVFLAVVAIVVVSQPWGNDGDHQPQNATQTTPPKNDNGHNSQSDGDGQKAKPEEKFADVPKIPLEDWSKGWQKPIRLSGAVNTADVDGSPTLSADECTLIFHRPFRDVPEGVRHDHQLYEARRESRDADFSKPVHLPGSINRLITTNPHLTADRLTLVFDSNCEPANGRMNLWIANRESIESPWLAPSNLGPNDELVRHTQSAFLSLDQLMLVYSSDRPGGLGNLDLWMAERSSKSEPFEDPVNLGPNVNSPQKETHPWLSADGRVLLFTAWRDDGIRYDDLWMATRESTEEDFGEAVLLGPEINTSAYEGHGWISPDGMRMYFETNNPALGCQEHDIVVSERKLP